jgi:hypothetical protein
MTHTCAQGCQLEDKRRRLRGKISKPQFNKLLEDTRHVKSIRIRHPVINQ